MLRTMYALCTSTSGVNYSIQGTVRQKPIHCMSKADDHVKIFRFGICVATVIADVTTLAVDVIYPGSTPIMWEWLSAT